jgi:hypothetical protein
MKEKFWMDQDDDKTFTATIHKLIRQFHSVATPENIRGSFVRAGVCVARSYPIYHRILERTDDGECELSTGLGT